MVERKITIAEVMEAQKKGLLKEAFGTGTAAVISPVGELFYQDTKVIINDKKIGPVAQFLYDEITGIQFGRKKDTHGWLVKV